jgi:ABC-2 type transport system ATP-binding protein
MKIESLTKRFGDLTAVQSVSLSLKSSELLCLLGPNGAGKTTLIRMLTGILQPDAGTVTLHDNPNPTRYHVSRAVGYCPQRIIVWRDLTCLEQLTMAGQMYRLSRGDARSRAIELLELFKLSAKQNALAKELSGGMQRRLSIALAMVHRPSILILDEPEAGLDPQSRVLVRHTLHQLCHNHDTTVIVSTHDMAEAEIISSRVAIINHGKLLGIGTAEEFIAKSGSSHLIELRLEDTSATQQSRLAEALSQLGVTARVVENNVILDSDAQGVLVRPVRTVAAHEHVSIAEVRHRRRTLEDVFLSLTANERGAA